MSSILDALRKLEAAQVEIARRPGVWTEPPRKTRRAGAGIVAAFVAGVALTVWLTSRGERAAVEHEAASRAAPELAREAAPAPAAVADRRAMPAPAAPAPVAMPAATAAVPAPAPPAGAPVAAPQAPAAVAAPAVVVPAAAAVAPPPAAVAAGTPADTALAPAAPAPPLPQAVVDAEPPRGHVVPTTPAEPPAALAARPPDAARPPADDTVLSRPPPGAPRVQLSFLVYSAVPERRTVALTVEGGGMVTLHEGESLRDVEVERIFSDRVQVRHSGRSFMVRPRD